MTKILAALALLLAHALPTVATAQIDAEAMQQLEQQFEQPTPINQIAAVVNDDVVLTSELEAEMRTVVDELRNQGAPMPAPEVLQRQVLERLILNRLQLQVAASSGIEVDDETLNRAVAGIAQRNGLTLRELRDTLEAEGYDFAAFREKIRDELIVRRVRQRQVNNQVTVTDQEVDAFLAKQQTPDIEQAEYRLAHILIAVPQAAAPDVLVAAKRRADELVARLRAGADFREAAMQYSDSEDALQGGDLGWRKAAQIPSVFAEMIAQMQPGDVTDPVRSMSGFHILKVVDTRTSSRLMVTQTHLRHILIKPSEIVSEQDAQLRLERIRERLQAGDDFATLARSHSDDTTSAVKGGDLGWNSPGKFVTEFEEVVNGLPVGAISEPFRTPFGWHVVQVLDRREQDQTEEVIRARARELIMERKVEEETEQWLRRLRDEAYVDYRLGLGEPEGS